MMDELSEKLYEKTGMDDTMLKLSGVHVFSAQKTVQFQFLYSEACPDIPSRKEEIAKAVSDILDSRLQIDVKFKKSYFAEDYFRFELYTYLKRFPSVFGYIEKDDIHAVLQPDNVVEADLKIDEKVYDYFVNAQIVKEIQAFLQFRYLQQFQFRVQKRAGGTVSYISKKIKADNGDSFKLEKADAGRLISVANQEDFIGDIIYDKAGYISDASARDSLILCGTIEDFAELSRRPKTPEDKEERKFYKFALRDFTGSIACIYFPSVKTKDKIQLLNSGKHIIARGSTEPDAYRGDGSLVFKIRDITLCTLPKAFKENRRMVTVPEEYVVAAPQPFHKAEQSDLFALQEETPKYLSGKTFCVFDVETTGLRPDSDDIIELGAVKVEDGVIKETFSTLIATDKLLSQKIIDLTGLTNADLEGKPPVKDVLMDFYKFSYGLPLVGQNVGFDYGFISEKGKKHHIYFDNERIDTIMLAKRYLKDLKKFTLEKITERLSVKNQGAHRAIHDAVATAEVFIKLSKYIEN